MTGLNGKVAQDTARAEDSDASFITGGYYLVDGGYTAV